MPPSQFDARLVENRTLRGGYFTLEFESMQSSSPLQGVLPGQFVMLRGQWDRDLLNPRAFSVLQAEGDRFSVLLKVFGRGTARMHEMRPGDTMTVTGPLGRAFPASSGSSSRPSGAEGRTQLLVAGGVGLPPLHMQARVAAESKAGRVELLYGGRNADDLVLLDDFERWAIPMHLATEDGSLGTRGFVTVPLQARLDAARDRNEPVEILSCGPTPMLRAVRELGLARNVPTFLCLEEEMACGFGVCLGCAVPVYGEKPYRYCCTDGPVFDAREVRWS